MPVSEGWLRASATGSFQDKWQCEQFTETFRIRQDLRPLQVERGIALHAWKCWLMSKIPEWFEELP